MKKRKPLRNPAHRHLSMADTKQYGKPKGNLNYSHYNKFRRSLSNEDPNIDTNALTEQFLANGGNITICPSKIA